MKKRIALSAIAIIILGLIVLAFTSNPSHSTDINTLATNEAQSKDTVIDQLQLSPTQKSNLQNIIAQAQPELREYAEKLRLLKGQMNTISSGDNYDATKIKALADQQAEIMSHIIIARTETQHKIYNVLTPEQKQKLKKIQNAMAQ